MDVQVIEEHQWRVDGHHSDGARVNAEIEYERDRTDEAYDTAVEMLRVQAERRGYRVLTDLSCDWDLDEQRVSLAAQGWMPS